MEAQANIGLEVAEKFVAYSDKGMTSMSTLSLQPPLLTSIIAPETVVTLWLLVASE